MEYGASRFPMSSHFFLTANEKDFSLAPEMTVWGSDAGTRLSLLPMEGGAPKGAEVGSRSGIKRNGEGAFSHITFPSTAEGAFFVYRSLFPSRMKRRDLGAYGVPCFPFSDARPFLS